MSTLGIYPNIRPKLTLDFVNRKSLDPRITFTRASTATYVGKDGLIKVAPSGQPRIDHDPATGAGKGLLIEQAGTNLLKYSSQLDQVGTWWELISAEISRDGTMAPDGTATGWFLREKAEDNQHRINSWDVRAITVGVPVTFSVYVRKHTFGTSPFVAQYPSAYAARTWASLAIWSGGNICRAWFNLSTDAGSKGSTSIDGTLGAIQSYNIVNAGNYWHRIDLTCLFDASISTVFSGVQIATGDLNAYYVGDGRSGIHVWGPQLESSNVATSYIPSVETFSGRTTAGTYYNSAGTLASAGAGVARNTYNPANLNLAPTLLLEPARTNLLINSAAFGSWTNNGLGAITSNAMVAPDGTTTADTTASVGGTWMQYYNTATAGQTYTYSIHVKPVDATKLLRIYVDGTAGTFYKDMYAYKADDNAQSNIQKLPNGWYRIWITYIAANTSTVVHIHPMDASLHGWWGAQLEAGPGPSSYIATTTVAVTRNADTHTSAVGTRDVDVASMTGANFSSWYNATEGTMVAEFDRKTDNISVIYAISDGTSSNYVHAYTSGTDIISAVAAAGAAAASWTLSAIVPSQNVTYKVATTYKLNDFAVAVQNNAPSTDDAGDVPVSPNVLYIGQNVAGAGVHTMRGHVRRLTYYNQRLTNDQLQSLTI